MVNKNLLISCIPQEPNLQQQFQQLLPTKSSNFKVLMLNDARELVDFFDGKDDYHDRVKHPLPNIMILVAELKHESTFDLLENLQMLASSRDIPKIILSQNLDKSLVKKAYDSGVTSVLCYHPETDALSQLMTKIYHYWLNTVELPMLSR
jgi:DNA-binding NarL/FixJ family response regulator